jgi:hypothetical protein
MMTLVDPQFISFTIIQVGKRIKDKKERVFGSASYEYYIRRAYTKRPKSLQDYGETPKYLEKRKDEMRRAQED